MASGLLLKASLPRLEIEQAKAQWVSHLDTEFEAGQTYKPNKADWLDGRWAGLTTPRGDSPDEQRHSTAVDLERLRFIGGRLGHVPKGFHIHPTVKRFVDARRKTLETEQGLDWATAEALAFGSLADEGFPVRLSGQDSERGTFSQRHAVLFDQENGERYNPLNNLHDAQARCEIINSMLSEEAVLAFEYGYTLAEPNALVVWEAQFGDFANGAQMVFDQFLSSGERKWLRMSGLGCLLPHGYDGQGPEHSSARLERYLQSSAEGNWQVANCTTPANYFHILRRQLKRNFRKPLILMAPKSLLRHKYCKSDLADLAGRSGFQSVLADDADAGRNGAPKLVDDRKIRRVLLCSGKIYYDLEEARKQRGVDDVYLLRVEQLYPFPSDRIAVELARFPTAEVVWCQEEPKNMGAWTFVEPHLELALSHFRGASKRVRYVGRPASSSTATGQMSKHIAQFQAVMEGAFLSN